MPTMPHTSVTTAEQLLTLHEPGYRHELVRGELRRMSGAGKWHGAVAMRLGSKLAVFVDEQSLGLVFAAKTGFQVAHDPDTVLCPDASFVATTATPGSTPPCASRTRPRNSPVPC